MGVWICGVLREGQGGTGVERAEEQDMFAGLDFAAFAQLLVGAEMGAIGEEVAYAGV